MEDVIQLDTGIIIAASCIYHNLSLFTRNRRHFGNILGLRLHGPGNIH